MQMDDVDSLKNWLESMYGFLGKDIDKFSHFFIIKNSNLRNFDKQIDSNIYKTVLIYLHIIRSHYKFKIMQIFLSDAKT